MAKKRSYKQNEVCQELDIQPYVLRFWETEFPFLKRGRRSAGPRTFSPTDVEMLRRIRVLLYEEGYTIAGARKRIEAEEAGSVEPPPVPVKATKPGKKAAPDNGELKRLRTGLTTVLAEARSLLSLLER